jgi:hypothetical protein
VKRRLFTILSALSLLLCVAVVGLWVRSHRRADSAGVGNDLGFTRCVTVHRGSLYLFQARSHAGEGVRRWHRESAPAAAFDTTAGDLRRMWRERRSRFGIERVRDDVRSPGLSGTGYVMCRVPLWMPAVAAGAVAPHSGHLSGVARRS